VTRIEYVASFPDNDRFSVWLGTDTDRQRDQLGSLLEEVRAVLLDVGFAPAQLAGLRTFVQSQETVDREAEGKWSYWLR
jgi:hypothetical protein